MLIDTYLLYKIKNILKFGVFSVVIFFVIIQFLIGSGYTIPKALFSLFYGLSIGAIYESTNTPSFYRKSFIYRNIVRIVLLVISITLIIIALQFSFNSFWSDEVANPLSIIFSKEFISIFIEIFIITFFIVFFIELEKHLGDHFIFNFFFSKYKKPIEENRVIMFLDLKDSTSIAEKIGNKAFVSFINYCYKIMSKSVIKNKATILKYVGDEVILTWKERKGIQNSNCVNMYFDFFDDLEKHKNDFIERYGIFPVFKAGLHSGEVTAAFLGSIKKQMDYSGDVMNTTARIQGVCNQYDANVLISSDLASLMPETEAFVYSKIGEVQFKGKAEKFPIKRVQRIYYKNN